MIATAPLSRSMLAGMQPTEPGLAQQVCLPATMTAVQAAVHSGQKAHTGG